MKISETFKKLKQKQEAALIAYTMAGFPSLEESIQNIQLLDKSGADIIEVGIPFSDPIADGPIIQEASQVALRNGATLNKIMDLLKRVVVSCPVVIMSYINPLLAYGKERLLKDLKSSRISGIIIPDLPIEESDEWIQLSRQSEIDLIFFITPTSTKERMQFVAEKSRGFIYCISITGTTGIRNQLPEELFGLITRMKQITDQPLAVGFGISAPEHIEILRDQIDGVIIGSRFIKAIQEKEDLVDLVNKFKAATRISRGRS
jgi:tryptophan synthase alpha chain